MEETVKIKNKSKLTNFKEKIKAFFANEYVKVFITLFVIGVAMFSYILLSNNFLLPINGDYVLQSYSFYASGYHKMWNFIKTGEFPLFDYSNFLGANYVGSSSFYYLFSPFFYLLLLCPSKWLYQGIFFHMIIKYATGGLLFYVLLRKYFHLKKFTSSLGAIIYSFSGWNLFYIWFHFSDVSALFPLILIGIERCLQKRKGGILTLAIFLMGVTNYFFFFTFALLGALYAFYRWIYLYGINKRLGHSAKERWGVLFQGILYFLAGALLSAIVVIPSMMVALDSGRGNSNLLIDFLRFFFKNPQRVNGSLKLGQFKDFSQFFKGKNLKELLKFIFVWPDRNIGGSEIISGKQNIGYILSGFLFMNTDVWSTTVFNTSNLDNSAGGLFITTPMIMMLVPAMIRGFKTKRPWTIFGIIICFIMPFIPFSFYLFHGFTLIYGRWLLFIMTIALIFILCTFDNFHEVKKPYILINFLINVVLGIFLVSYSYKHGTLTNEFKIYAIVFQMIYMVVVWLIIGFGYIKWKWLKKILFVMVIGEVAMSAIITVEMKGYVSYQYFMGGTARKEEQEKIIKDLKNADNSFYRIYNSLATRGNVNLPSDLGYNGVSVFNSIYNFENKEFIDRSRMAYGGSWSMGYHEKRYYFDQFVGIKYYIVDKLDKNNDTYLNDPYDGRTNRNEEQMEYRWNIPWNFELYKSYKYYDVYINKDHIELGFAYDDFVSNRNVSSLLYSNNYSSHGSEYEELYSKTVIVKEEDRKDLEEAGFSAISSYKSAYKVADSYQFDKELSLREDCSIGESTCYISVPGEFDGDIFDYARTMTRRSTKDELESFAAKRTEVANFLPSGSNFFHSRYADFNFFGDQFIYELRTGNICPLASEDNVCYLNVPVKMGPRILISLYNGDQLITQDAHMDFHSDDTEEYEWKYERGFYVDQPVNKIVLEFLSDTGLHSMYRTGSENMQSMKVYYTYQSDTKTALERFRASPIENIVYKTNSFTFETNYDERKIVVLQVPYDEGWSLTVNGKEKTIYNFDGGFVGFIAPSGKANYKLVYHTPKMKQGFMISLGGLLLFIALWAVYKFWLKPVQPEFISAYLPKEKNDENEKPKRKVNNNSKTRKIKKNKPKWKKKR